MCADAPDLHIVRVRPRLAIALQAQLSRSSAPMRRVARSKICWIRRRVCNTPPASLDSP